ncbi:MAG: hypothetical protein ABIJ53_03910 [Verrucomicrobiota bacterium]
MITKALLGVSVLVMAILTAQAVEDGLGTNVVRNLRVNDGGALELGGEAITNWATMPVGTGAVSLVDYLATNAVFTDATGSLNTAVGYLNTSTGSLNTAVGNLNDRTNAWNNGVVIKTGTGTLIAGNLYYMGGGSVWSNANASTNTTARGLIGLALGTSPSSGLLLNGQWGTNSHGFALGAPLYMQTNNNLITATQPFRTNHVVRIVGYAIDANTIMFNPDRTYIEILGE